MCPRPGAREPHADGLLQESIESSDCRKRGGIRDAPEGRTFFFIRGFSVTESEEVVNGDDGVADDKDCKHTGENVLVFVGELYADLQVQFLAQITAKSRGKDTLRELSACRRFSNRSEVD